MAPLKIVVFGHKGWIGKTIMDEVTAQGHNAVGATSRADDVDAVKANLAAEKPDRVISLVGRTRGGDFTTIDYLEQKGKLVENMRDNLWGPVVLAQACKEAGIHFTYMGTGCIFHYEHPEAYPKTSDKDRDYSIGSKQGFTEESLPNFFGSGYSTCKGFTDRMMHLMFNESALNVRIRMPITPDNSPYNFITKIVNYNKVVDIPNSMTVLPALMPIMVDMSIKKTAGTINLTHPGAISHNECLALYKKHVDPTYTWDNFTVEEQEKILLSGRSNNLLEAGKLKQLYPDVDDIHTAVEKICIDMAKAFPKGICTREIKKE